jgi:dimethylamine/trimethylamine dehydrogenase
MLEGKRPPGQRVVVWDCEGYFMAAGMAEKLALEGHGVELVTALERIAPFCDETLEGALLRQHLHAAGVGQRSGVLLETIEPGKARGLDEFGDPVELAADAVVLVTQRLSDESLYLELRALGEELLGEGIEAVYRIGDCVAPRLIADVVFDGHRLAREIDSENPAVPLPYRRERAVMATLA